MLLVLALSLVALVGAAPSSVGKIRDSVTGVPGYFEVPVEWDIQAFPGGPVLTLNGTVQEVHSQLLRINPNYDTDFGLNKPQPRDLSILRRTDFSNTNVNCDSGRFGKCSVDALGSGINYLRGLKGQPRNGGGPGACGRVSCSHNTAIWWCNDSRNPKTLNSWGSIADGAQRVWSICAGRLDYGFYPGEVSGQAFHPTDWNVIVERNSC